MFCLFEVGVPVKFRGVAVALGADGVEGCLQGGAGFGVEVAIGLQFICINLEESVNGGWPLLTELADGEVGFCGGGGGCYAG